MYRITTQVVLVTIDLARYHKTPYHGSPPPSKVIQSNEYGYNP